MFDTYYIIIILRFTLYFEYIDIKTACNLDVYLFFVYNYKICVWPFFHIDVTPSTQYNIMMVISYNLTTLQFKNVKIVPIIIIDDQSRAVKN